MELLVWNPTTKNVQQPQQKKWGHATYSSFLRIREFLYPVGLDFFVPQRKKRCLQEGRRVLEKNSFQYRQQEKHFEVQLTSSAAFLLKAKWAWLKSWSLAGCHMKKCYIYIMKWASNTKPVCLTAKSHSFWTDLQLMCIYLLLIWRHLLLIKTNSDNLIWCVFFKNHLIWVTSIRGTKSDTYSIV